MGRRTIAAVATAFLFAPLSQTYAQSVGATPYIEAVGSATTESPNNQFSIEIGAKGSGRTRAAALEAASARADILRTILPRIAALSEVEIISTTPRVSATGPGCDDEQEMPCRPTGFNTTISTRIRAKPATAAGAALVILEEQGFETYSLDFSLANRSQLIKVAQRTAFENAKVIATEAATIANCQIGKLLNLEFDDNFRNFGTETVIVTGARREAASPLTPGFNLRLEPGKATATLKVRTRFELLCGGS